MDSSSDKPVPSPSSSEEEGEVQSDPQARMIRGLVRLIACSDLVSLSFGECLSFEEYIKPLNSKFIPVPKSTIESESIKIFNEMRTQVKSELSVFKGVISITCELWFNENDLNYISVYAHFLDSNWIMQKRMLGFRMIEYPYNAHNVFEIMVDMFNHYGIVDKISIITFSNRIVTDGDGGGGGGDSIFGMFKNHLKPPYGGQVFGINCVCDTINSIVRNGLSLIDEHLERIRCVVRYVYSPPDGKEQFFDLCKSHNLTCRRFKPDYLNQWNSTLMMLESCVNYDGVLTEYNNSKIDDNRLCEKDWEVCFAFMEFMKICYGAVNVSSKVYHPTACVVLNQLYDISVVFAKYRDHSLFEDVFRKMEESFKKYLMEFLSPVFCLAAVMDARIKLDGVELLLNGISENMNMPLSVNVNDVKVLLNSLFSGYESKFANATKLAHPPLLNDSWSVIAKRAKRKTFENELEKYLENEFTFFFTKEEMEKFDILEWWKAHEDNFPVLSIMARDLLTPSVSTIAKSVFSSDNRTLNEERSSLDVEVVESLFCMKDWEHAETRRQSWTDKEMIDYFAKLDSSGDESDDDLGDWFNNDGDEADDDGEEAYDGDEADDDGEEAFDGDEAYGDEEAYDDDDDDEADD